MGLRYTSLSGLVRWFPSAVFLAAILLLFSPQGALVSCLLLAPFAAVAFSSWCLGKLLKLTPRSILALEILQIVLFGLFVFQELRIFRALLS